MALRPAATSWSVSLWGAKVLAIFQGEDSYVTPAWYETKRQTGKVVPTWNCVVVHAHGELTVRDDGAWVRGQIEALTDVREKRQQSRRRFFRASMNFRTRCITAAPGPAIHLSLAKPRRRGRG